jgi:hypothetical protein
MSNAGETLSTLKFANSAKKAIMPHNTFDSPRIIKTLNGDLVKAYNEEKAKRINLQ